MSCSHQQFICVYLKTFIIPPPHTHTDHFITSHHFTHFQTTPAHILPSTQSYKAGCGLSNLVLFDIPVQPAIMSLTGSLMGFWIIAFITTLPSTNVGGNLFLQPLMSSSHPTNLTFFISAKRKTHTLWAPDVPFPPAFPTYENLYDICYSSHARPRYPPSFFPKSGVSHYRRRGKAINRLESWFTSCCSGQVAQDVAQILCCAQQAVSVLLLMH